MADQNQRDLVLNPGQYAYIQDETKALIDIVVGPSVTNLSGTQRTMLFDQTRKQFSPAKSLAEGIQNVVVVPERYYAVLYNPEPSGKVPESAAKSNSPKLQEGHKIVLHGPTSVTPWPGQMVKRAKGHNLRSNQYVMIEVYDVTSATANWDKAFSSCPELLAQKDTIAIGAKYIVRGETLQFFMPFTGVEIVRDEKALAVREAVTLARLEYCVLIEEDGTARNEKGPNVVFPTPTEVFKVTNVERDGTSTLTRKFRAYELQPTTGLHFKVIQKWTGPDGKEYNEGEEVFITGNECKLFYPPQELAIIKYENRELHYATMIPKGQARYVMNRKTGNVRMERGEAMCLLDPREEVFYTRALELKTCELLYPNNIEALALNAARRNIDLEEYLASRRPDDVVGGDFRMTESTKGVGATRKGAGVRHAVSHNASSDLLGGYLGDTAGSRGLREGAAKDFGGDSFNRTGQYTPPRSVQLDFKYDGAVMVKLFPGYAMMLVSTDGTRRVEQGPKTVLLNYEEEPVALSLSTGTPKSGRVALRTAFLQITENKVSDSLLAETNDYCGVNVRLSYRLNFVGDPNKWFAVEDYVGFITDHLRTLIRREVGKHSIQQFYPNSVDILRDALLGNADEQGKRKGYLFEVNGVHIYDVDVTSVQVSDSTIEAQFADAKRSVFKNSLALDEQHRALLFLRENTQLLTEKAQVEIDNLLKHEQFQQTGLRYQLATALARTDAENQKQEAQHVLSTRGVENERALVHIMLETHQAKELQRIALLDQNNTVELTRIERELAAQSNAMVAKLGAISPQLAHAFDRLAETAIVKELSGNLNVLSILGGESIAGVFKSLLGGTRFATLLESPRNGNGAKQERSVIEG